MKLAKDYLNNCVIKIDPLTYVVGQTVRVPDQYLAVIKTQDETTVVVEISQQQSIPWLKVEPNWRLLTFDVELPFELVGFLAIIATELAEASISIFVLSSYATDHLLVKSSDLEKAIVVLERLGCIVPLKE